MKNLTPRQIVAELDRFIIGQADAKRAVAVAIRNRWRRQQLDPELARDILPKNIIMVGPTGVGKTEIARRLAHLTGAPFVKVEASKFTEVGYHGRDVESLVRDLLESAIAMLREEEADRVQTLAAAAAEEQLLDILLPPTPAPHTGVTDDPTRPRPTDHTRERLREQLAAGQLDDREVEIALTQKPAASVMFANMGIDQMDGDMANVFERLLPEQTKTLKVPLAEARRILEDQETEKLIDRDKLTGEAIRRTEESGIVFLDEIDKIAVPGAGGGGGNDGSRGGNPDVSREGVQRDLLPIVEGSAVTTRHGIVHTDHILFIAAGAFHQASVTDLMPELQGRFPIRVELAALGRDDFVRILTEPKNALTTQQQALLEVEGLHVQFEDKAIYTIADLAAQANAKLGNVGARRLATIVERVFEVINFDAPQLVEAGDTDYPITEGYVNQRVLPTMQDEDLSKFLL